MLSLADGIGAGGGVVVVEVEPLVEVSVVVVVGGFSRLLQPARPAMAAAMNRVPNTPVMARVRVVLVVMV
jgi:hypothetical protein